MKLPGIAILMFAILATALGDGKNEPIAELKAFEGDVRHLPHLYTEVKFETYKSAEVGIARSLQTLRERLAKTGEKVGVSFIISGEDTEARILVGLDHASLADIFDRIASEAGYRWTVDPGVPKPMFYRVDG